MKRRVRMILAVVIGLCIVSQCGYVFGGTSGQNVKTVTVYEWLEVVGGGSDKQPNGSSQDCDFSVSGPTGKTIFKCKYYKKYTSSSDNYGTLYCECDNPSNSIDPGATVSLNMYLHADITQNTGKGMYMQGMVFFGTPGLDIAGTDNLKDREYFKTSDSEHLFSIGNITGFDDQNHTISATMPKSTKEGEQISIYFKTTAGVQEWRYQLAAFKKEVPDDSPSTEEKQEQDKTETPTAVKNIKLTASNKTFKASVKTKKYIVTLKSGSASIKNAKLTLKVNGKTYKAVTNAKGKATFKITKLKKKGKFTTTIKFAGDKTYKAASKKVKITVKK